MISRDFFSDDDLIAHLTRPDFEPVQYLHIEYNTPCVVISQNEFRLHTFSVEGSKHEVPFKGSLIECTMQYDASAPDESGRINRYAGPVTVYLDNDGEFWLRPSYEFVERYRKID